MIELLTKDHIATVEFRRKQINPTFCCDYHKRRWNEERLDTYDLSRREYMKKYGIELFTGISTWDRIDGRVNDELKKKIITVLCWQSKADLQIMLNKTIDNT